MSTIGAQIRAARAMLSPRREDLARTASLHPNAVQYWEKREVPAGPQPYAVERILAALKAKGVETFSDPNPALLPRSGRAPDSGEEPAPGRAHHGARR